MEFITTATATDEAARAATIAVLPVGSFEQHGGHLPLATDTIVASAIASAIATQYQLFVLPPITIACSHEHAAWPSTVSIRAATLAAVIADIRESLAHSGIDRLAIVNGHGGNYVLSNIVQEANVSGPRLALYPQRPDWEAARAAASLHSTLHDDMHAGELETSLLLHIRPELVHDSYTSADHTAGRPHLLELGISAYTRTGVIGEPSHATPGKGKAILDSLTTSFETTRRILAATS